jgi:hypothetical protein
MWARTKAPPSDAMSSSKPAAASLGRHEDGRVRALNRPARPPCPANLRPAALWQPRSHHARSYGLAEAAYLSWAAFTLAKLRHTEFLPAEFHPFADPLGVHQAAHQSAERAFTHDL